MANQKLQRVRHKNDPYRSDVNGIANPITTYKSPDSSSRFFSTPVADVPLTDCYLVIAHPSHPDPVLNMETFSPDRQEGIDPKPSVFSREEYILYIDDDPDDRENFEYALEQCNAKINLTTAVDADDAIKKLAVEQKPACIYLDVNMPKMNGIQLLKILKSKPDVAHIPVIIFSTAVDKKSREEAINLGAAGVILKPSSFQGLLDHLCISVSTGFQTPHCPNDPDRQEQPNRR